jgi:hypothetical protein
LHPDLANVFFGAPRIIVAEHTAILSFHTEATRNNFIGDIRRLATLDAMVGDSPQIVAVPLNVMHAWRTSDTKWEENIPGEIFVAVRGADDNPKAWNVCPEDAGAVDALNNCSFAKQLNKFGAYHPSSIFTSSEVILEGEKLQVLDSPPQEVCCVFHRFGIVRLFFRFFFFQGWKSNCQVWK